MNDPKSDQPNLPAPAYPAGRRQAGIPEKFLKPYNPASTETDIYAKWEESGYFNPDNLPGERTESFSIVLPPPNVTGTLHMGHASMLAVEDTLVRFERMRGKKALWLPGTDHAAIATQSVVEKKIYKEEGKSRHDIGREEMLARIGEFAQASHDTIVHQVRAMGSSLDWSREAFTLDDARSLAVRTAFKNMYDAGLIYRKNRIVNWDPKGQTTVSDDEVVYEEATASLYTFKYAADFPIAIATTRPETKVGDTAVAVHPEDKRYSEYIGKTYDVDFAGAKLSIKIIGDKEVDPEFGTGAVGVTPAHSMVDWEMAERHELPVLQVINEYAKMTDAAGTLVTGLKTKDAREKVVEWLKENNLLEKEEAIQNNISKAERTGGIIEPLPKLQWFIDVNKPFTLPHSDIDGIESGSETTLKEIMRKTVSAGQIEIMPERFNKQYEHWIDNLRDWCISRQIWYGHRVPVWYRGEEMHVGIDAPEGEGWQQDEDTLDTWFSSGLWTFSTLGWPNETEDMKNFHPTALLETGYDILFFWVARMILMTGFNLGTIPFHNVYLHGLVRDAKGRKMSKSLGNILDPRDMIAKYGADATRLSLLIGAQPGNDIKLAEDKIKGYKHFANKLWNITRFVLTSTSEQDGWEKAQPEQAYIDEINAVTEFVTEHLEKFRLDLAADHLYHYVWHRLADEILEESKAVLGTGGEAAMARAKTLYTLLSTSLKLLHPFMPFVTEEIWQALPETDVDMLIVAPWPQ